MRVAGMWALLAILFVAGGVCHGEDAVQAACTKAAEKIKAELTKVLPEATLEDKSDGISIDYKTREFMVHRRNKTGDWDKEAKKARGPDRDGFVMSFFVLAGRYGGAAERDARPQFSAANAHREQYWYGSYSLLTFGQDAYNAQVNILFGEGADAKLLERVYELVAGALKEALPTK